MTANVDGEYQILPM